jgi:hypothetical protein
MNRWSIGLVLALAAWSLFFSFTPLRGLFWISPGALRFLTDSGLTVVDVERDSPASRAGIHIGDRFDASTTSFEDRLILEGLRNPWRGQTFNLRVVDAGGSHTVKIGVPESQSGRLHASDYIYYFAGMFIDATIILVGSILLLLRPSKMTWAFFFTSIAMLPALFFISFWLPPWLNFAAMTIGLALSSVGYGAFLIICVRVPNDRITGGWRYVERVGAPLVCLSLLTCNALIALSLLGKLHVDVAAGRAQALIASTAYAIGISALIATFVRVRGIDRNRVGWIIAGFALGLGSTEAANLANLFGPLFPSIPGNPSLLQFLPLFLPLAIPIAVGYAVVRHHALDVGFVAKRTIVYGTFLILALALFVLLDVFVSKRLANNDFEIGMDVAVALAVGLCFQVFHRRAMRTIDRVFLPERYRAAVALDRLRETLPKDRSGANEPKRMMGAIADGLSISSLAVFRRLADGGMIRYASAGWPDGSAWHIFAEDLPARPLGAMHIVRIDEAAIAKLNFPNSHGSPRVGIGLADGIVLFVGAHTDGTRSDHDEVRGIASLIREAMRF